MLHARNISDHALVGVIINNGSNKPKQNQSISPNIFKHSNKDTQHIRSSSRFQRVNPCRNRSRPLGPHIRGDRAGDRRSWRGYATARRVHMKSEGGGRKSFGERRGGEVGDPPASILRVRGDSFGEKRGWKFVDPPGSILRVREAQNSFGERRDGKVGLPPLRAATRNSFNTTLDIWS